MSDEYRTSYLQRLGKLGSMLDSFHKISSHCHRYGLLVFAGDHGISQEGYSAYAPLSSHILVERHLQGESPVSRLLLRVDRPELLVDVGLYHPVRHPAIISRPVRQGCRSFLEGDALEPEEVSRAVQIGLSIWDEISGWDFDIIGLGEIGVGNSLAAEAITCTLTGLSPEMVVGQGSAGSKVIRQKIDIIDRAVKQKSPDPDGYLDILSRFGGLEIAALAGFITGAPQAGVPVVLDGFITAVAAALAAMINPQIPDWLLAPGRAAEKGHQLILDRLGLDFTWDLQMNYGEGLAAAISMFLIEILSSEDFIPNNRYDHTDIDHISHIKADWGQQLT